MEQSHTINYSKTLLCLQSPVKRMRCYFCHLSFVTSRKAEVQLCFLAHIRKKSRKKKPSVLFLICFEWSWNVRFKQSPSRWNLAGPFQKWQTESVTFPSTSNLLNTTLSYNFIKTQALLITMVSAMKSQHITNHTHTHTLWPSQINSCALSK